MARFTKPRANKSEADDTSAVFAFPAGGRFADVMIQLDGKEEPSSVELATALTPAQLTQLDKIKAAIVAAALQARGYTKQ